MNILNQIRKITQYRFIPFTKYKFKSCQYGKNTKLHFPLIRFPFSSHSQQSHSQKIDDILKQPNNYDSTQIMNEYKNFLKDTKGSYTQIMEISNQFLRQMKIRNDNSNAVEICQIVVDLCTSKFKDNSENPHMFFKGQQALLQFKLGQKEESYQIAESLYNDFTTSMNKLKTPYLIMCAKFLLEVMAQINCLHIAKNLLSDISDLLAQDNWQSLSPLHIFEVYYLQFGVMFLDGNYNEAAEQGWKAYQQLLKLNNSPFRPDYILTGIYICYKELNQTTKCREALVEIQKIEQISQEYLDALDKSYIQPFISETEEERQKKFKKREQNSDKTENNNTQKNNNESRDNSSEEGEQKGSEQNNQESFSNRENEDDKGSYFIRNQLFKEGIAYYKEQLAKLDMKKDALKYVFLQDRMAFLYCEVQDYQKAIHLCFNSQQILHSLFNNKMVKNYETFQNISYLKTIYEKSGDLNNAIEWGQTWNTYCLNHKLFDIESPVIESNMLSYINTLKDAQMIQESLEYCQFVIKYLTKFNNGKEKVKFGLYQLIFYLSSQDQNWKRQKDAAITLCELSKQIKKNDTEYKEYYFIMLKQAVDLSLEEGDFANFIKYGQEFLAVRSEYEDQFKNIEYTVNVMFNLGQQFVQQNQFTDAVKVLQNALELSKRAPIEANQIQMNLLLTTLYLLQNKLDDAEEYLTQAIYLFDNHHTSLDNKLTLETDILKIASILFYHKENYEKSLDLIEQYLQKLYSSQSKDIYEDIITVLSNLQSIPEFQSKALEIISKYNIEIQQ